VGQVTKISWCDHTFNPWRGCTKVSAGCANCYAEVQSRRNPAVLGEWGKGGARAVAAESYWRQPFAWDRAAEKSGKPTLVFCASLADVFEGRDTMPESSWVAVEAARARLFSVIDRTPNLRWLLLTKRPENIKKMWPAVGFPDAGVPGILGRLHLSNVWLGTSVENQAVAHRIDELLKCCGLSPVLWLSVEPLLGPLNLEPYLQYSTFHEHCGMGFGARERQGIDWVVVGGESQAGARPMHPDWARNLRDQCVAASVPFHFKQWGEYGPEQVKPVAFTRVRSGVPMDEPVGMFRVGKESAGRLLDGREWLEFPRAMSQ
jgi:protein gp37